MRRRAGGERLRIAWFLAAGWFLFVVPQAPALWDDAFRAVPSLHALVSHPSLRACLTLFGALLLATGATDLGLLEDSRS